MGQEDKKIWQPLHPAVREKLDPEYVRFHDEFAQYVKPDDLMIWDGTARTQPSLPPGGLPPIPVGNTQDFDIDRFRLRAYTPQGTCPQGGWPILVWFHGGGWAIGGLGDNVDFCTKICQEAQCCVITVEYRMAPETPFPGAVEDSIDAVRWIASSPPDLGNVDTSRIILGGTSAGATLAIVSAISALDNEVALPSARPSMPVPNTVTSRVIGLMLIVPVIDNTATTEGIWKRNGKTAPWLTPARMEWYRKLYFAKDQDRLTWDASPSLTPHALLSKLPKTWIAISEQDLLAPEAEKFGSQLKDLGIDVTLVIVEGGTHSILTLGAKVAKSRKLMEDAVNYLKIVITRTSRT